MPGKKHTHKYMRRLVAGTQVWACALGDCSHYLPKHMEDLIDGRNSICWDCEDTFTLDAIALEKHKPICSACDGRADLAMNVALSIPTDDMPESLRKLLESK